MADQVDTVPDAAVEIVEAADFVPSNHLVDVLRQDGGSCHCGQWYFYSQTCSHVYQVFEAKCGRKRTGKGVRTAFCPQTSTRILTSKVKVNAPCPDAACQ